MSVSVVPFVQEAAVSTWRFDIMVPPHLHTRILYICNFTQWLLIYLGFKPPPKRIPTCHGYSWTPVSSPPAILFLLGMPQLHRQSPTIYCQHKQHFKLAECHLSWWGSWLRWQWQQDGTTLTLCWWCVMLLCAQTYNHTQSKQSMRRVLLCNAFIIKKLNSDIIQLAQSFLRIWMHALYPYFWV